MHSAVQIVEAFFLSVICIGAFTGNVFYFIAVAKTKRLQSKSRVFLLNLAAADLLVSVFSMPVTLLTIITEDWILGEKVCQAAGFFTLLTFVASCMGLTMISVNRYHVIVHWNTYHNTFCRWKCAMYVVIVWAITIGLSIPPFFGWASFHFDQGQSYCFVEWTESKSYTIFMIAACLLGPLFVMTYCYVRIICIKRRSRRDVEFVGQSCQTIPHDRTLHSMNVLSNRIATTHHDRRLTRIVISLIVVFAFCWSPFAVIMIIQVFTAIPVPRCFDFGSLILGYLNSFLNVFVYNITNRDIRLAYKKLLSCRRNQVDIGLNHRPFQ